VFIGALDFPFSSDLARSTKVIFFVYICSRVWQGTEYNAPMVETIKGCRSLAVVLMHTGQLAPTDDHVLSYRSGFPFEAPGHSPAILATQKYCGTRSQPHCR